MNANLFLNCRCSSREESIEKLVFALAETSEIFSVRSDELLGKTRGENPVCWARIAAMATLWDAGVTLKMIGAFFGGRDHATVINAVRRLPDIITYCPQFAKNVQALRQSLGVPQI